MKNNFLRKLILWLVILTTTIGAVSFLLGKPLNTELSYNVYRDKLLNKELSDLNVQIEGGVYLISGKFLATKKAFITVGPIHEGSTVIQDLQASKAKVTYKKEKGENILFSLFTSLFPLILIGLFFFFMLNQAQGGGSKVMNFGKSKAKLYNNEKKRITFGDVAGAEEEKNELVEVVDFLKDNTKYIKMGARIPRGVLLVGPPGTGKTLLARAVAGEAKVPFFSISGSDFVEMFVGVGASRVRDLFEQAKKSSPSIIFIDEIDAVGRQRATGMGNSHDEREQTLNQLLVEMDGFDATSGVIIIAATNRSDVLDPALLRPGRFDRQITVNTPDVAGREAILKIHARNKPIASDVTFENIAHRTMGFSGADLENVLNEAALLSAREGKKEIGLNEIDEAIDRVIMGPQKKSKVVVQKEKEIVSYHEAGHVVVGYFLADANMVHKVTIVPRGNAGGYAMILPKEDRYILTKKELLDRITGYLGGRVAEEIVFNEVTTGASDDFKQATALVKAMITEYGMSDTLAPMLFKSSGGQIFMGRDSADISHSDKLAHEIDLEMQNIIKNCYDKAKELIIKHRDKLNLLASTLMEKETLVREEIEQLMETGKISVKATSEPNDEIKLNIQSKSESNDQDDDKKET